jgi:hypothetical protein
MKWTQLAAVLAMLTTAGRALPQPPSASLGPSGAEREGAKPSAPQLIILPMISPAASGQWTPNPDAPDGSKVFFYQAAPAPADAAKPASADRIIALVNGAPNLDDELRMTTSRDLLQAAGLPEPARTQRQLEIVSAQLEKLIERELILSDALPRLNTRPQALDRLREAASKEFDKKILAIKELARAQGLKVDDDDEFIVLMEEQGFPLKLFRRAIERDFIAMEYMRHKMFSVHEKIGPDEIRRYYDDHSSEFRVKTDAGSRLAPLDEKTQEKIKQRLRNIVTDREYRRIIAELRSKATVEVPAPNR